MMLNIEAKNRVCIFLFFSRGPDPPNDDFELRKRRLGRYSCKSCIGLGKPGLQVDLLTRARVCGTRAHERGGGGGQADEGTKGQRQEETKGRREDETEGRRYEGTTNEATKERRHEGRRDDKQDW